MRHALIRTLSSAVLVALMLAHVAGAIRVPLVSTLDSMLYDLHVQWLSPRTPDERVAIVDIDEKSLRERSRGGEGRWPWPRDRLAALIQSLFSDQGASLVALDLILSERDQSSGLPVLEALGRGELQTNPGFQSALNRLRPRLEFDEVLGQAMQAGPVVLGMAFHNDPQSGAAELPPGHHPSVWGLQRLRAQSYPSCTAPVALLQARAAAIGHLNPLRDPDGVTRRVPLLVEYQDRYYPALAVAALQVLTGSPDLGMGVADYGRGDRRVESVQIGPLELPVDGALNAAIPFRGPARTYTYVSAVDVLQGRVPKDSLKNRIVLVGTSAAGLSDLVTTPMGVSFPGVEVHANLISAALDGSVLMTPAYVQGIQALAVCVVGLLMMVAGARLKPVPQVLVLLLLMGLLAAASGGLVTSLHLVVPMAAALMCLCAVFVFQMTFGFFVESRGFREMTRLFAYYVPPELVEKMAQQPQAYSMAALEKTLSVMFVDVRDFTSTSEKLTPAQLAEWINVYLSEMSRVIKVQHQGTLDKYIGDAVMAFWGAPVSDHDHAQHAVRAALDMQASARRLSEDFVARGWPPLAIGVGVNTGPMVVGDMGSNVRKAYTVMGDAVNLASRLEGLTKVYGVGVLIGHDTRQALQGWVCREVDRVKVKGKDQAVAIYEPLCTEAQLDAQTQEELWQWNEVLVHYRHQAWSSAREGLAALQQQHPQKKLYALYQSRVEAMEREGAALGEDWDGSTQFKTK